MGLPSRNASSSSTVGMTSPRDCVFVFCSNIMGATAKTGCDSVALAPDPINAYSRLWAVVVKINIGYHWHTECFRRGGWHMRLHCPPSAHTSGYVHCPRCGGIVAAAAVRQYKHSEMSVMGDTSVYTMCVYECIIGTRTGSLIRMGAHIRDWSPDRPGIGVRRTGAADATAAIDTPRGHTLGQFLFVPQVHPPQ